MSSFTDSERHPSLMGLGGFWHDKTEQNSALPIFWSDVQDCYHKPQKSSQRQGLSASSLYSAGNKKPQCLSKSNATKQATAHVTWGMEGDGVCQLHCFPESSTSSVSPYTPCCLLPPSAPQPQWDLTGNYPVHRSALQKLLSCMHCVHSHLRKNSSQILPLWLTVEYHPKSSKDKGLS